MKLDNFFYIFILLNGLLRSCLSKRYFDVKKDVDINDRNVKKEPKFLEHTDT